MLENLQNELQKRLSEQIEWLLVRSSGRNFALQNSEIELQFGSNKVLFGFLDDKGFQTWRITACELEDDEVVLKLSRDFGRETEKIRLVPRVSARELGENVELARLEKANQIAAIIKENFPRINFIRVELNKENGRFAQMLFENPNGSQIAVLADVSDVLTPEIIHSSAILWLTKLENRRKNFVEIVWIICEKKAARNTQKLHALLKDNWKKKILIKEISRQGAKAQSIDKSPEENSLIELSSLEIKELWRTKTNEIKPIEYAQMGETAAEIIKLAPEEIDAIFSKHGETLRFQGLPFARVRKIFDEEQIWFGIERSRQILTENNRKDLLELVENLKIYRRFDSPNKRHAFYSLAPESWLEALLRKNIKLLDANLVLSPLYHQFRAGRDKIDLLALRKDGRLVIIEIKVAPDREMIFQAADYWRKIELQRRKGNLKKARIFGDIEIADKPAIVYLVAPTLSFHRDFEFLADTISSEIKIHRFNLAENWREKLKVLERRAINKDRQDKQDEKL
jgi:hypothetical protein